MDIMSSHRFKKKKTGTQKVTTKLSMDPEQLEEVHNFMKTLTLEISR